jgi:peptidyl-prolyl cis-trans isomerase C
MLDARAWTMSAAAFVLQLAKDAEIEGIVLDGDVVSHLP